MFFNKYYVKLLVFLLALLRIAIIVVRIQWDISMTMVRNIMATLKVSSCNHVFDSKSCNS